MAKKSKPISAKSNIIARNKKAFYEYFIEERFEAGIVLQGWEVKSIREGRVQLIDSYIHIKKNEIWLFNTFITPLHSASTHIVVTPNSTRKLLLNQYEINKLLIKVKQKGYAIVPLGMHWKNCYVKVEIAIVKGKKLHDKRQSLQEHNWKREKERLHKITTVRNNKA